MQMGVLVVVGGSVMCGAHSQGPQSGSMRLSAEVRAPWFR